MMNELQKLFYLVGHLARRAYNLEGLILSQNYVFQRQKHAKFALKIYMITETSYWITVL